MTIDEIQATLMALARAHRSGDAGAAEAPVSDEIDSLEGVETLMDAEDAFGIRIPDADLGDICRSVRSMAEYIHERLERRDAAAAAVR